MCCLHTKVSFSEHAGFPNPRFFSCLTGLGFLTLTKSHIPTCLCVTLYAVRVYARHKFPTTECGKGTTWYQNQVEASRMQKGDLNTSGYKKHTWISLVRQDENSYNRARPEKIKCITMQRVRTKYSRGEKTNSRNKVGRDRAYLQHQMRWLGEGVEIVQVHWWKEMKFMPNTQPTPILKENEEEQGEKEP